MLSHGIAYRDVFYQDPQFFVTQRAVDSTIEDIACTIKVPRYCLNIVAGVKGLFAGPIQIRSLDGNITADGLSGGDQVSFVVMQLMGKKLDRIAEYVGPISPVRRQNS